MKLIDTHFYDGSLKFISTDPTAKARYHSALAEILQETNKLLDRDSCSRIRNVLNIVHPGDKHNYDPSNNIDFEELLPAIWDKVRTMDTAEKMLFLEQFSDIDRGSCAQGRTTRIMQFHHLLN